jgi:prepilin peptidase CpaA
MAIPVRLLLAIFVLVAAIYDLRARQVPNWLTMSALTVAVVLQGATGGPHGLRSAGLGFALALLLTLPLFALRGLGGGDVKLMAASGAMTGPAAFLVLFAVNAILGGIVALVLLLRKRRAATTLRNAGVILNQIVHGRAPYRNREDLAVGGSGAITLPRAPIFAAVALVVAIFTP